MRTLFMRNNAGFFGVFFVVFFVAASVLFSTFIPTKTAYAFPCTGQDDKGIFQPVGCDPKEKAPAPKAEEKKDTGTNASAPATGAAPATGDTAANSSQSFTERALLFIASICLDVAVVLSKLVITVLEVLMPVMTYNNFANNPVVDSGWAILRDTVNMFFVIVLIAIAFGTIFGKTDRFKWQQQLPRLMIFAIVINFSRTLCGLMIDVGQVVMLTFANAIREIAAGNFVQMLGMGEIYSMSSNSGPLVDAAAGTGSAAGAFDYFASAIASVFMMLIVLCVMVMLLVLLMYRIVMLWVLITISPLAWFVGGAGDLVKSGAYAEWWGQFKCLITIGPILTFFLWLTLVVAGSGDIATTAEFVTTGSGPANVAGGFLTSIFELPRLISFIVSIGLLWAGFDAAQGSCTNMPGIGNPSAFIKSGATRLAKGSTAMAAKVGAYGVRKAGSGVKTVVSGAYSGSGMQGGVAKAKEKMYRDTANKMPNWIPGSEKMKRVAAGKADALASERSAKITKAGDKFKGDSADTKNDILRGRAKSGAMTTAGKQEEQALMLEAMKDPKRMQELQADGTFDKLWARHGKSLEENAKGDKGMKATVDAFKKANPQSDADWIDPKKHPQEAREQAASLSAQALSKPGARERLAQIDSGIAQFDQDGKPIKSTMAEAMEQGRIGTDAQRRALVDGPGAIYEDMKPEQLAKIGPNILAQNLTSGLMGKQLPGGKSVGDALVQSKDPGIQAVLQGHLDYAGDEKGKQNARDALLGQMGMDASTGDVDEAKMGAALAANPSLLTNMMGRAKTPEQKAKLSGLLSNNKDVFKGAMATVRKGGKEGDEMRKLMDAYFEGRKPSIDPMKKAFDAQVGSIDKRKAKADEKAGAKKSAEEKAQEEEKKADISAFLDSSLQMVDKAREKANDYAATPQDTKASLKSAEEKKKAEAAVQERAQMIAGDDALKKGLDDQIKEMEEELKQAADELNTEQISYETGKDGVLVEVERKLDIKGEKKVGALKNKEEELKQKLTQARQLQQQVQVVGLRTETKQQEEQKSAEQKELRAVKAEKIAEEKLGSSKAEEAFFGKPE